MSIISCDYSVVIRTLFDSVKFVHPLSVTSKNINGCTYNAYGVAVSEVEVDVLTGEVQILRVDILYDCGQR